MDSDENVVEDAAVEAEIPEEVPGFAIIYSIAGIITVSGLLLRKRN